MAEAMTPEQIKERAETLARKWTDRPDHWHGSLADDILALVTDATTAATRERERLREALERIARPPILDSTTFHIKRDGERVLVTEQHNLQWRMDLASKALAAGGGG